MEKGRFWGVLVLSATLLGAFVARADQAAPMTQAHKKRKSHKPTPPKVSDKCTTDAECAFTAYDDGACCPMLCPPRVVAKTSAEAIEKYAAVCKKPEGGCPVPECMPPRIVTQPACVSGKCVARAAPSQGRE